MTTQRLTGSPGTGLSATLWFLLFFFASGPSALTQTVQYTRPVETAPQEKTIGGGYKTPPVQKPRPRDYWLQVLDVVLLAAAMGVSIWIVLKRRSRNWLSALTIGSLAYFGFYREGCVCPIGSIQNVVVAIADPRYSIPMVVIAAFFLPLMIAVFYGRAFCGGVCALGAMQELVLVKPVQVPRRLDRALGLLKYAYLGLAIFFALRPALARDFLICRFDPFVGFFRRTGAPHMLMLGGLFLLVGMFVGRPYCRYLCPYGGLLSWCSRLARRGVSVTPDEELDCGLCTEACPYGAIEKMRAVSSDCVYCARCYESCPREKARLRAIARKAMPAPARSPIVSAARQKQITRWVALASGFAVAACVTILVVNYVLALSTAPKDDALIKGLQVRVKTEATVAPELAALKQPVTSSRIARKNSDTMVGWVLILSAASFLTSVKRVMPPKPPYRPPKPNRT